MKRISMLLLTILFMTSCASALAAKARSISSNTDSAYHAEHLQRHIGESSCFATGNYIKVYNKSKGNKVTGHLEQADEFILLAVNDNQVQIEITRSDKTSPDSWNGMTGWVNSDYIDCICDLNAYVTPNSAISLTQYPSTLPDGWTFSSGAGAWSTELCINPDGSFYGYYHDADGLTYYESYFNGHFSDIQQNDDHSYSMYVSDLQINGLLDYTYYQGDIQHIITKPSGIQQGDRFIVYMPGTSKKQLSEEHLAWLHGIISNPLNSYALCNMTQNIAFDPGAEYPENLQYSSAYAKLDYRCKANNLRIRNAPNGPQILGHLEQDDQFIVNAIADGWAHIFVTHAAQTSPDSWRGLSGWVSMDYVEKHSALASASSWAAAYRNYLSDNDIFSELGEYAAFWLIHVNADPIPELIIDTQIIAGGCYILTYDGKRVDAEIIGSTGIPAYIEKENLLLDSAGHQGNYYDTVYTIANGKWKEIYHADNYEYPSPTYDIDGKIIHTFYIGNQEVTQDEYDSRLRQYFDSSKAIQLTDGISTRFLKQALQ